MQYKLLVLDVDGTLVSDNSQTISERLIKAIKTASKELMVILCTGRSIVDLQEIITVTELENSYHIIESGAKLLKPGLEIEFTRPIAKSDAEYIISQAERFTDGYSICVDGKWIESKKTSKPFSEINEASNISTVSFYVDDGNKTNDVLSKLPKGDQYHIVVGSHWYEINGNQIMYTNPLASKSESLQYLQNKLSITKDETICIGDMPNDIPMFERSGFKICMGNGHPKLKELADVITSDVTEDGAAEAIEKFILTSVS